MSGRRGIGVNAAGFLLRGMSLALVAVWVLPRTRVLSGPDQRGWLLLYALGLPFTLSEGLVIAIAARRVASSTPVGRVRAPNSAEFRMAFVVCRKPLALAWGALAVFAPVTILYLRHIPQVDAADITRAVIVMVAAQALAALAATFHGAAVGRRLSLLSGGVSVVGRLAQSAVIVVGAVSGHASATLFSTSFLVASATSLAGILTLALLTTHRLQPLHPAEAGPGATDRDFGRTAVVWALSGALYGAFDLPLLRALAGEVSVSSYAAATTVVALLTGSVSALTTPFLAAGREAALHDEDVDLGGILVRSTRIITLAAVAAAAGLLALVPVWTRLWGPSVHRSTFVTVLTLLAVGQVLLQSTGVFPMLCAALGHERVARWTPPMVVAANVVADLVLGALFGYAGIAAATVVSAATAVALQFGRNLPRVPSGFATATPARVARAVVPLYGVAAVVGALAMVCYR